MSRHGRGAGLHRSATVAPVPSPQKRGNLELFMECVDEDLAPSQQEAGRKAETEYRTAIQHVQSVNSAASAETSTSKTASKAGLTKPAVSSSGRGRPRGTTTAAATALSNGRGRGLPVTPAQGRGRPRGRGRGTRVTSAPASAGELLLSYNSLQIHYCLTQACTSVWASPFWIVRHVRLPTSLYTCSCVTVQNLVTRSSRV